jgi:hypothetical protein
VHGVVAGNAHRAQCIGGAVSAANHGVHEMILKNPAEPELLKACGLRSGESLH